MLTATVNIVSMGNCCNCGTPIYADEFIKNRRHEDGKSFFCINGHSQIYTESLKERLKHAEWVASAERARADQQKAKADEESRKRIQAEGDLAIAKNRTACGVCPHCRRAFKALHRHIKTQHPKEYAECRSKKVGK